MADKDKKKKVNTETTVDTEKKIETPQETKTEETTEEVKTKEVETIIETVEVENKEEKKEVEEIKELSPLQKQWKVYLEYQQITPQEFIERSPGHPAVEIIKSLI